MKNPLIYYAVIALGVIALAVGVYYLTLANLPHDFHAVRAYGGLGGGIVLILIGIVGIVMARPRTAK